MGVRTQVYLPEELYRRLKLRARLTGRSLASQIRESLERYLAEEEVAEPRPDDPIWAIVGAAETETGDLSLRHDAYLYGWEKGKR